MNSYANLKTSIAAWLAQSNITASDAIVDDFLDIAEAETYRRLRVRAMESTATLSTVAAQDYVALPTDYLALRGVYRDGSPQYSMQYYTPEQLNSVANSTRAPNAFSLRGDNMLFAGPADGVYDIKIHYYAKPAALSASNTTNWLTANYPQLLLWGALKAAAIYVSDDALLQKYTALHDRAIAELQQADDMDTHGPAPIMQSESSKW
jgi:hypothetical protein